MPIATAYICERCGYYVEGWPSDALCPSCGEDALIEYAEYCREEDDES